MHLVYFAVICDGEGIQSQKPSQKLVLCARHAPLTHRGKQKNLNNNWFESGQTIQSMPAKRFRKNSSKSEKKISFGIFIYYHTL